VSVGTCRPYESARESARVLVVDADRDATSTLASLLGELGCDVSYAFDARLALLYGRKCKAHVVFLDLATPHVAGAELTTAFRKEKTLAGCALIALCAYADETSHEASRRMGFDGVLAKPVRRPELEATLRPLFPALVASPMRK
jgi:CheY-like chemotaxis protein